ncbi:MAG: hypothetical protein IPH12_03095 [Saprospirales bacterium]|nr:hypothetical protein [Saprospirales bacterium]MBK8921892.1 hypothetical protein [Saprospirales bacterium]
MNRATHCVHSSAAAPLLLLLAFVLNSSRLSAQDLQIYYDLFTDSITYKLDGKLVEKPKIRKGDFVVLHFTEFNPYLYNAEVDIEQSNSEEWSGGASSGALGPASILMNTLLPMSGSADGSPGGGGILSLLDMPLLGAGENSIKLRDLFANSRGADQILAEAQTQLHALTQIQAEMAQVYQEIQALEKSERAAQLASQHLDQLLLNPRIKPSLIRRIAAEYQDLIFPNKPASALQVTDAFEWQERPLVKRRLLQELQAKQQQFDAQLVGLAPIADQLSDLDAGSPALEAFAADLQRIVGKGGSLRQQLEAYLAAQSEKSTTQLSLEEMLALQMKFRELAEQPFAYPVAISVEKSTVIATAYFEPLDSTVSTARDKKLATKTKTVKLETSGGLRISTGFGISFARMFTPLEEFSARENAIFAEESGVVQPFLTTFIHFYPNNHRSVTLAGSFGLGIPLSTSNLTTLNFYLGPSLLFGRGQRIVLSGGLTAGPAKRLAKGFEVGDPFDSDQGDIPTRTQYELGYFLGISFNLGG